MEGAVLGGKLAAEVVVDKDKGIVKELKEIQKSVIDKCVGLEEKEPVGVKGEGGQESLCCGVTQPHSTLALNLDVRFLHDAAWSR